MFARESQLMISRVFLQERVHLVNASSDPGECRPHFAIGNNRVGRRFAGLKHLELALKRRTDLYPVLDQIIDGDHQSLLQVYANSPESPPVPLALRKDAAAAPSLTCAAIDCVCPELPNCKAVER
jgi:hypothetical protein